MGKHLDLQFTLSGASCSTTVSGISHPFKHRWSGLIWHLSQLSINQNFVMEDKTTGQKKRQRAHWTSGTGFSPLWQQVLQRFVIFFGFSNEFSNFPLSLLCDNKFCNALQLFSTFLHCVFSDEFSNVPLSLLTTSFATFKMSCVGLKMRQRQSQFRSNQLANNFELFRQDKASFWRGRKNLWYLNWTKTSLHLQFEMWKVKIQKKNWLMERWIVKKGGVCDVYTMLQSQCGYGEQL